LSSPTGTYFDLVALSMLVQVAAEVLSLQRCHW
jgi:hypothetical protein